MKGEKKWWSIRIKCEEKKERKNEKRINGEIQENYKRRWR